MTVTLIILPFSFFLHSFLWPYHTHRNDFDTEYCGIRLLWDACVRYRCYGVDERRGGRLFIYREEQPEAVTTHMIRTLSKV